MSRVDTADIMRAVDQIIAARDELVARGVPAGDVIVMTGCALGVMLAGRDGR